jgi:hypothetical protein
MVEQKKSNKNFWGLFLGSGAFQSLFAPGSLVFFALLCPFCSHSREHFEPKTEENKQESSTISARKLSSENSINFETLRPDSDP